SQERRNRIRRRSDPSKFQKDYYDSNITNTYSLSDVYSSSRGISNPLNFNNVINSGIATQNMSSISSHYWNNTSKRNNDEIKNDREYFQENEINSLFNPEYMNSRNSIWKENDDHKTPKTNINARILPSSNNRGNKNNSRNSRRIPTTTLNMSTTANQNNQNNNNNNNNRQANLSVQQLTQLLQNHAHTVN